MTSLRLRLIGAALAATAALGGGILFADLASAHDSDRSADRVAEREARIEQKLASGDITHERAAELRERLAEHQARHEARQAQREELAELLGLTVDELHEAHHGGSSLADLATAAGVAINNVIDLLETQAEAKIDAAVEQGRLTEEAAAERTSDLRDRIEARVNGEHDGADDRDGRQRGRGHHRGHRGDHSHRGHHNHNGG